MSRSSDARRPYVRSTRSIVRRAAEGLASAAGRAEPIERANIEPLEPRKLLFSLTIDASDDPDGDGIGTVVNQFGYFIPYLDTNIEENDEPNAILVEEFNDEDIGRFNSGEIFDGSDIFFRSNGAVTNITAPTGGMDGDVIEELAVFDIDSFFGQTAFMSFGALIDADDIGAGFLVNTGVTFTTGISRGNADVGADQGLFNGQIDVQLRFRGQVVDTWTNAELLALVGGQPGSNDVDITLFSRGTEFGRAFDEIRFVGNPGGDPPDTAEFFIDDLTFSQPAGNAIELIDERAYGVEATFTAPVGATVSFFDLYGRPLRNTFELGDPGTGSNVAFGDFDDNGIPEYNDGIGSIVITGTDANSNFSMVGLELDGFGTGDAPDDAIETQTTFAVTYPDGLNLFDDFADVGFGFLRAPEPDGEDVAILGLPPGTGTVIIGSPFVRPQGNYNPFDAAPNSSFTQLDFQISDQGIFVNQAADGSPVSIGSVNTSAAVFGLSNFSGSVGHFSSGYFMGSMAVAGDLGSFYNATDAGTWIPVGDNIPDDVDVDLFTVGSQLLVGRTLGEFAVAGRNFVDITIDGDLSAPTVAPADDVLVYNEREVVLGIDPASDNALINSFISQFSADPDNTLNQLPPVFVSSSLATIESTRVLPSIYGDTNFRNDTILNAEFIGGAASTAVVRGSVGAADAFNIIEDEGDVYAFATDGSREIVIEQLNIAPSGIRILDADGRVVASTQIDAGTDAGRLLRFTPDAPGVYYISVLDSNNGQPSPQVFSNYAFLITGMAPTTFGSYRTGLGNGGNDENPVATVNTADDVATVSVLSGSVGVVRVGTGYVNAAGVEAAPFGVINTRSNADSLFTHSGFTLSTPGSLYSYNSGGDINADFDDAPNAVTLSIGRDLGQFYTGRSQVVGGGDASFVFIETGGRVGTIFIGGYLGGDSDELAVTGVAGSDGLPFSVRTGLDADQSGDIGFITIGGHVAGDQLIIDTSATPGSVVGGLAVSQLIGNTGEFPTAANEQGFYFGDDGPILLLGDGSDIRFVDTPRIDLLEGIDVTIPIRTNEPIELIDDAGGRVQISVSLETAVPQNVGRIIIVPVEGAEGVAIARIEVNLTGTGNVAGGTTLNINSFPSGSDDDVISIGRIVVTESDAGSQILINGETEVDVWRIDAPQGLLRVENNTEGGDIVALDTQSLDTIRILEGDLGRTQVPEYGPRLIGPILGLQIGVNTGVFGAMGVDISGNVGVTADILDPDLFGGIFRPTNDGTVLAGAAFAEDVGFPINDTLNGVVVRQGGLTLAEASGAVGDVILQGGDLLTVRANSDNLTEPGRFDGIIGSIFSPVHIDLVDVGQGLVSSETGTGTPFAEGGIFAQGFIRRIEATDPGAFINGIIAASTAIDAPASTIQPNTAGIDSLIVNSNGGGIFDSDIRLSQLDAFWAGFRLDGDTTLRGAVRELTVTNGDIFRSQISTNELSIMRVSGGAFDASTLDVRGRVTGEISADEFRNTTLDGGRLEFRPSLITVAEDLERLSTINNGSISDTQVSVVGEVRGSITAGDIVRSAIEVANTLRTLTIRGDMLASELVVGQLITLSVENSIRVSSITVSGPLETLRVQNEIDRSDISVTGPNGRIDLIEVVNDLDANISSSGRIGTIRSSAGSIDGSIVTTNSSADIMSIDAAVDILATTDIGGNLAGIEAGRNIGDASDPGVILVRGNLTELDVEDGRLLSDLRVGGSVTSEIVIGGVTNLPTDPKDADGDILVFGRIEEIDITGDFDGRITSESSGIGTITITDGSLLTTGAVIANDGGLGALSIIRGHLLGTVYAELTINRILVDGQGTAFGDIGINPNLSSGVGTNTNDPNRNQLPPGVVATLGVDGPTIASGRGINTITVTSGDIYEAFIYARTSIGLIDVRAGNITLNDNVNTRDANVIAAGDLIQNVTVSGNARSVLLLAGATSFGDDSIFSIGDPQYDDTAGGTDDTLKSGVIRSVSIGGDASNVAFSAGITAGNDGLYNTSDAGERNVLGFSVIDQVTIGGTQTNVTFNADRGAVFLNGTNVRGSNFGASTPNEGGQLASLVDAFAGGSVDLGALGTEVPRNGSATFSWNGTSFRVEWTDPTPPTPAEEAGQGVIWDGNGTLILANTRIDQSVVITVLDDDANGATALPELVDFNIRSNDEASIGTLRIQGENGRSKLSGNSNIVVDNYVQTLEIDDYEGTGGIAVGEDIDTLTVDRFAGGSVSANFVRTTNVNLSLVSLSGNAPRFDYSGAGSFNVAQNATATVNIERSINSVDIDGTASRFLFRAGGSLTSFSAGEVERSRLSVSNVIDSIDVDGDVFDSAFIAGGDLGSDATDGDGTASSEIDRATSGTINTVDIGGNFAESDLVAGFLRGGDGFFATADDDGAAGNSSIGTVEIGGSTVGSNVNSESYGLLSAGGIARATIGGDDAESRGNFTVGEIVGEPIPIEVTNFRVVQDSRFYTAFFTFNQNINEVSFIQALRIREIRDEASAAQPFDPSDPLSLVAPTPGVPGSGDYSVTYDEDEFIFAVTFNRTITDRDLLPVVDPADPDGVVTGTRQDLPSPGVYRFEILSDLLRGSNAQARLDGNGDGFAEPGENFSFDDIVGDAGDVAGPRGLERVTQTGANNNRVTVDFYDAVDLDLVLDSNDTPDGLPEINTVFTLAGALADHPDRDLDIFGFGGDKDVYSITLQAGQILRLGEAQGPANQLVRTLYFQPTDGSDPLIQYSASGIEESYAETDQTIVLLSDAADAIEGELVTDSDILIKETGTYYLVIEAGAVLGTPFIPGAVPNTDPQAGQTGNYAFTVEIFDDGDSGFNAGSDAGNGTNVVNAPDLSLFSTTDPTDRVVIDDFTFQRLAGADGVFGNADDTVSGQSSDGALVSTRSGNRLVSTIESSIGPAGSTGQPGEIFADLDVFHLNNFQPITAGTFMTITVKLAESGSDLGSVNEADVAEEREDLSLDNIIGRDPSQAVQFALFETTQSDSQQRGDLVFSPTDFTSRAGTPDTIIAQNGANRYGFDANGDFFISFVIPPSVAGGNGSYAVYLQGVFRADYQIEVVTQGTGQLPTGSQNVLIETNGGSVDWLTVNGTSVSFGAFDAEALGFSGLVSNVTVEEFILANLTDRLNQIYANAGLDITFSIDPSDFEFEEFSTVFLTSDNNPIDLLQASDYGVSERSDPFNSDPEDEAVVFTPVYTTLGYNPSPEDLDSFIDSLVNGVGRRVGELVGLRLTEANLASEAGGNIDIFNEESIAFPFVDPEDLTTESNYIIPGTSRELVSHVDGPLGVDDTGFFIGDQNAAGLLSIYLD